MVQVPDRMRKVWKYGARMGVKVKCQRTTAQLPASMRNGFQQALRSISHPFHPSHLSSYLKVHPLAYARALKSMSSTVVSACQPPAWSMASRRQTPAVPLNPTKSVGVCGSALERRGTGPCSLTFKQALNPGSAD